MKPSDKEYESIVKHYEQCFDKFGDSHLGVDWPKEEDVDKRYKIMLELLKINNETGESSLLDLGCGLAHFYDFIQKTNYKNLIKYTGLDYSPKFIEKCKSKYPDLNFMTGDMLDSAFHTEEYDYIIINGVFTEKRELTFNTMWEYFCKMIQRLFILSKKGIALNVMSKQVAWEREDLFHVPLDQLASFLCNNITRKFIIRNDYGLYEYTVYIYK